MSDQRSHVIQGLVFLTSAVISLAATFPIKGINRYGQTFYSLRAVLR